MMMSKTVWQDSNLQPPDYKSGSLPHNHNFFKWKSYLLPTTTFLSRVSMQLLLFITHKMHAERDIVLPFMSVCPSVQCPYCV